MRGRESGGRLDHRPHEGVVPGDVPGRRGVSRRAQENRRGADERHAGRPVAALRGARTRGRSVRRSRERLGRSARAHGVVDTCALLCT